MRRTYNLADRKIIVRGINADTVLYDVEFTKNDLRDLQTLEDEFPHLLKTTCRNPHRSLIMSTDKMAKRLAVQGHYLRGCDKVVIPTLTAAGYNL